MTISTSLRDRIAMDPFIISNIIPSDAVCDLFNAKMHKATSKDNIFAVFGRYAIEYPITRQNKRYFSDEIAMVVIGVRKGDLYVSNDEFGFFVKDKNDFIEMKINADDKNELKVLMGIWRIALILSENKTPGFDKINIIDVKNTIWQDSDKKYTISLASDFSIKEITPNNETTYISRIIKPVDYEQRIDVLRNTYPNTYEALSMMLFEAISPAPRKNIFILLDDGGTGKTTLLKAFIKAYPNIVASITVRSLTAGAFEKGTEISSMIHRKAIIADEAGLIDNNALSILGAISTGMYDTARYGGGKVDKVYVEAIPIIATNTLPDYDKIDAFKRRTIIIRSNSHNNEEYWKQQSPIDNLNIHDYISQKETIDSMLYYGKDLFNELKGKYDTLLMSNDETTPVGIITYDLARELDSKIPKLDDIQNKTQKIDTMLWSDIIKKDKMILRQAKCSSIVSVYKGDKEVNGKIQRVFYTENASLLRKIVDKTLDNS